MGIISIKMRQIWKIKNKMAEEELREDEIHPLDQNTVGGDQGKATTTGVGNTQETEEVENLREIKEELTTNNEELKNEKMELQAQLQRARTSGKIAWVLFALSTIALAFVLMGSKSKNDEPQKPQVENILPTTGNEIVTPVDGGGQVDENVLDAPTMEESEIVAASIIPAEPANPKPAAKAKALTSEMKTLGISWDDVNVANGHNTFILGEIRKAQSEDDLVNATKRLANYDKLVEGKLQKSGISRKKAKTLDFRNTWAATSSLLTQKANFLAQIELNDMQGVKKELKGYRQMLDGKIAINAELLSICDELKKLLEEGGESINIPQALQKRIDSTIPQGISSEEVLTQEFTKAIKLTVKTFSK